MELAIDGDAANARATDEPEILVGTRSQVAVFDEFAQYKDLERAFSMQTARGRIDAIFELPTGLYGGKPEVAIGASDCLLGIAVRIGQRKHAEFPVRCDAPDRPAGLVGAKVIVSPSGKPDRPI